MTDILVTREGAVFAPKGKFCVHVCIWKVALQISVIYSSGIQSFTSITTSTASLTLKALLDFEYTTSYELYLRITDTNTGWTGNITIKVNNFLSQSKIKFNSVWFNWSQSTSFPETFDWLGGSQGVPRPQNQGKVPANEVVVAISTSRGFLHWEPNA